MAFQEIVAPTLREMFLQQVLEKIFSGELKSGDRLPPERELSKQMHISRSMVHVGLEDLARMGFVRMEPRRGNFVTDYARSGNFETLAAIAKYGGNLAPELKVSMVEMRNAIVGGALIRLSNRHTGEDLEHLRAVTQALRESASKNEGPEQYAQYMRQFETTITVLSGNSLFPLMMNAFGSVSTILWENCVRFWGVETILEQQGQLTALIESGRGHDAARYIENIFLHYCETHAEEKRLYVNSWGRAK